MPTWNKVPPERIAAILEDIRNGLTRLQVAHRYKLAKSTVDRFVLAAKKSGKNVDKRPDAVPASESPEVGSLTETIPNAAIVPAGTVLAANGRNISKTAKYVHLRPQIEELKKQGFSMSEVAKKLGIPPHGVNYYFYGSTYQRNKKLKQNRTDEGETNGHASIAPALNKHEAVGIAYAEVERLIGILGERLGFPAAILRPRLSELLGRSQVR